MMSKCVGEFVGTFFLVLTVGCNVLTGSIGAALSIGSILMVMIYAIGPVSGAHLNPAVTVAVLISDVLKAKKASANFGILLYLVPQLLGGLFAGIVYSWICANTFTLEPVGRYSWKTAAILEMLYTSALCYVVLNVATVPSKAGNNYFGLAIGFTVVAAAMAIGGISGCSLNPAVSFGAMVVDSLHVGFSTAMRYFALYFFVPFFGSLLGAGAFHVVNLDEPREQ